MTAENQSNSALLSFDFARNTLLAAAVYNIIWGAAVVLFPVWTFEISGAPAPLNAIFLWQCIGMIVGVYGIGYAVASTDPFRHWPIVLVGLLGKIFGPIGFVWSLIQGSIGLGFGVHIIFNDLIWWIPFSAVLIATYRRYLDSGISHRNDELILQATVRSANAATSVRELSHTRPVLLIFFRHAGCCFCRELLADVAKQRRELEQHAALCFVFMQETPALTELLNKLELSDVPRISDPDAQLYRAGGMQRAGLTRLFGLQELLRGIKTVARFGVGNLAGDGFMLPGSLLIAGGRITARSLPSRAAEQPELCLWQSVA